MNEELDKIEKNGTWELSPKCKDKNFIGFKCVFKNNMNEKGQVVRNKENEAQDEELEDTKTHSKGLSRHTQKNRPENQIIGDKSEGVQTRR